MRVTIDSIEFDSPRGFLVFEGVNGAGKSTLMQKVADFTKQAGRETVLTREPGATQIGKEIRKILMGNEPGALSPLAELFLFSADRAHHVETLIQPALAKNKIVLSDRYYYSTAAFQGYGRRLDKRCIKDVCTYAIQDTKPDCVILLDLDPEVGLQRTKQRAAGETDSERDSFEEEELAFHNRLRTGFLEIAESYSENFLVLDASKGPDTLFENVLPLLEKWMEKLSE